MSDGWAILPSRGGRALANTSDELTGYEVAATDLEPCLGRLALFCERYAPRFLRREQRGHAVTYIEGLLSGLGRKTIEPIATAHDQERRPLQQFVGAGAFDDDLLLRELRTHVAEVIGDRAGVFVVDPTCFEKKGTESVGVKRQWNGRTGKTDNCQKGVLLGYAAPRGMAVVDRRLYLPKEWARDEGQRTKCHVPKNVKFRKSWEIALDLLDEAKGIPHAWIVGDDEFGRPAVFRKRLRKRNERYALDVPSNTLVRPIRPSAHAPADALRPRRPDRMGADEWARTRPEGAWVRVLVRDGTKGPHFVLATSAEVHAKFNGAWGDRERLVVTKTISRIPEYNYILSSAGPEVPIGTIVCARGIRHSIEQLIGRAKGEAGLAHYEVRSWIGWHHHMTLSLMASWFLTLELDCIKKNACAELPPNGGSDRLSLA